MTPERIAELRELNQVYGEKWFFHPTLGELLGAIEAAQQEIADLKRGGVVEIELSEDDWIEASDEMLDPLSDRRCSHNWRDSFPEGITVKHAREKCGSDKIRFFRRSRATPADRVLGEGDRFDIGFVEACGLLAARPFDRPTLAAGLIREGGMVAALERTSSDGAGIEILREEMRSDLDALRAQLAQEPAP